MLEYLPSTKENAMVGCMDIKDVCIPELESGASQEHGVWPLA